MPPKKKASRRPAMTDEGREKQLVSQAIDLAEKQIQAGTASAQVLTHYLKAGSSRERLEQRRLEQENRLLEAKIEQMQAQQRIEELYGEALAAMSAYRGDPDRVLDYELENEFYD